eukprot:CAMPEP_0202406620 /NCGR_PEP_ID=MMETSP1128-20130828/9801_1 /ASSEMBLY_ACC=CAM_ASM_000463 /TAXON_ID=3047 /ORGANISM="Dunaliella tertiolecta, Strain CCMP1320" /LENGTH=123 /DNA_ID=CAMNT_0049011471 /DNA_START=1086 /DNA_END=1458 /DNA_ORIENTATION=-
MVAIHAHPTAGVSRSALGGAWYQGEKVSQGNKVVVAAQPCSPQPPAGTASKHGQVPGARWGRTAGGVAEGEVLGGAARVWRQVGVHMQPSRSRQAVAHAPTHAPLPHDTCTELVQGVPSAKQT